MSSRNPVLPAQSGKDMMSLCEAEINHRTLPAGAAARLLAACGSLELPDESSGARVEPADLPPRGRPPSRATLTPIAPDMDAKTVAPARNIQPVVLERWNARFTSCRASG